MGAPGFQKLTSPREARKSKPPRFFLGCLSEARAVPARSSNEASTRRCGPGLPGLGAPSAWTLAGGAIITSPMAIADLRREYNLSGLRRRDLAPEPLAQFRFWFDQAAGARAGGRVFKFFVGLYKAFAMLMGAPPPDVNAMTLATADKEGRPSARTVLLKGIDERGFVFFTNYDSRKGLQLAENPHAALVFYWPELERQICISGSVRQVSAADSDAYFASRPRGSQIGAWASQQSRPVKDRVALDQQMKAAEARFAGQAVTRPPHWGGYVLEPNRIEFWQGRPNRLHDRFLYSKGPEGQWKVERLSP
jgi:pyridoxamine 5'-phosphate oxidase